MIIFFLGFGSTLVALIYAKTAALWRHEINLRHYFIADPGGKLEVQSMHEELSGFEAKCCINCAVSLCQQHLEFLQPLW